MLGLTTGQCAARLNQALGMEVIDADFIRGEIDERRLVARVDVTTEAGRKRRYIRVHPDDFCAYVDQRWSQYAATIRQMFHASAA